MKTSDVRFISSDSEDEQVTRWYTVDDELFGVVTDQNDRGVRLVDADSTPLASR